MTQISKEKTIVYSIKADLPSKRENGLKFFSIRMRILNSEYFLWIQLDSIRFNYMQLD